MPKLNGISENGRIPTGHKLRRLVELLLGASIEPAEAVIALTDVYVGNDPPEFKDAADAKKKMREWVGPNPAFHPHAAQFEFEAWLLPYWSDIQRLAQSNKAASWANPELVNHGTPPSHHIRAVFLSGKSRRRYVKPRDANKILQGKDLYTSANECPELKGFLNTILGLCHGDLIL